MGRDLAELGPGGHITKILNNRSGLDVNPAEQKAVRGGWSGIQPFVSGVNLSGALALCFVRTHSAGLNKWEGLRRWLCICGALIVISLPRKEVAPLPSATPPPRGVWFHSLQIRAQCSPDQ